MRITRHKGWLRTPCKVHLVANNPSPAQCSPFQVAAVPADAAARVLERVAASQQRGVAPVMAFGLLQHECKLSVQVGGDLQGAFTVQPSCFCPVALVCQQWQREVASCRHPCGVHIVPLEHETGSLPGSLALPLHLSLLPRPDHTSTALWCAQGVKL